MRRVIVFMFAIACVACSPDGASPPSAQEARFAAAQAAAEATPEVEPPAPIETPPVAAEPPPAAPARALPDDYITFPRACEAGDTLTIAAVGDVLIHRELQKQAWKEPDHFAGLWRGVADLVAAADLSYANLEGPTAPGLNRQGQEVKDPGRKFDNKVYTGYARFNYHPQIIKDLRATGFDIVSTANNHALDRQSLGAERTMDQLEAAKMRYTGTRRQGKTSGGWVSILKKNDLRVAWLACTKNTNGFEDPHRQVLRCYDDEAEIIETVKKLKRGGRVDAIIFLPHWGREYKHTPSKRQRKLAQKVLDAGALAVIGNHPHVVQPWERYTTKDGREAMIMYSLGNFVSHQPELPKRTTLLLYLGLTRDPETREVRLNGARYVPLHTRHDAARDFYHTEAIDRVGGWEDARSLIVSLMGPSNLLPPDAPLVTNPHCDAAWQFAESIAP